MPNGRFEVNDIPQDEVDTVVANYQLEDPVSVEKIEQENGLWTVVAVFPGEDVE